MKKFFSKAKDFVANLIINHVKDGVVFENTVHHTMKKRVECTEVVFSHKVLDAFSESIKDHFSTSVTDVRLRSVSYTKSTRKLVKIIIEFINGEDLDAVIQVNVAPIMIGEDEGYMFEEGVLVYEKN